MWLVLLSSLAFARDFTPEILGKNTLQVELNVQHIGNEQFLFPTLFHYGINPWLELQLESFIVQTSPQQTSYQGVGCNSIVKIRDGHDWIPAIALLASVMPPIKAPFGGYTTALIDWEIGDRVVLILHPGISGYDQQGSMAYGYMGTHIAFGERFPLDLYLGGGIESPLQTPDQTLGTTLTEIVVAWNDNVETGIYTQWYPTAQSNPFLVTTGVNWVHQY